MANQTNSISLKDICRNASGGRDFVGIDINNKEHAVTVYFPLGYHIDKSSDEKLQDDVLLLLKTLRNFCPELQRNRVLPLKSKSDPDNENTFPLFVYQRMINHYMNVGAYTENEIVYDKAKQGKINWARTIKQTKAHIHDNNAIYLDFIVKSSVVNQQTLLAEIYRHCVDICFKKIGWMFKGIKPPNLKLKYNKKLFVSVLKEKLGKTFNDKTKELFTDMLTVIQVYNEVTDSLDRHKYGTNRFEEVWEEMMESIFGSEDKSKYEPTAKWHLIDKQEQSCLEPLVPLKPDTIMKEDDNFYVLDAKYYTFGCMENRKRLYLPETSDIHKQITYGERIFVMTGGSKKVFNAFLMPADKDLKGDPSADKDKYCSRYIGYADADWKKENIIVNAKQQAGTSVTKKQPKEKPYYEKVAGILIDTKEAMDSCFSNDTSGKLKKAYWKKVLRLL